MLDAHSSTTLRFRPFMAFRSVREFTHENSAANRDYQLVDNGIKTQMYKGYPYLYMQFSKGNEFVFHPDWYRGIEYPKEQERGYDSYEDLYVPGYFETEIKKGESIVFSASTSEIKTGGLLKLFQNEVDERNPRDNFYHCLVNAAHQFHNTKNGSECYLLSGYPWFKSRARDTFISLPGLTLAIDEVGYFEKVMATAGKGYKEFMREKPVTVSLSEIDQPDVPLWAIWSIQQYAKVVGDEKCLKKYGKFIFDILHFLLEGKHPYMRVEDNGLVYVDGKGKVMTWMNSTVNGRLVVPRNGYIVEINSLWYNALGFAARLNKIEGDAQFTETLEELSARCKESFVKTFLNDYGYLFDYVDGNMMDWSVRPNMLFAIALDYSPLTADQRKSILDICTRELLTPKGMRTLSPKSGGYNPICAGPQMQRDLSYHQGTAWPWLGGFYMEACLKIYRRTRLSFIERQLVGYEDEMQTNCLGTLPEMFDGNPPFKARGAISFAMNVGETLRTLSILENTQI